MDMETLKQEIEQACLEAALAMGPRLRTMSWFARNTGTPPETRRGR